MLPVGAALIQTDGNEAGNWSFSRLCERALKLFYVQSVYRMIREERSILWEVTESVNVRKKESSYEHVS